MKNKEQLVTHALGINEDKRMLREELNLIHDYVSKVYKGGNSLEIGAYKGMTSYLLASFIAQYKKATGKHYVVDNFDQRIKSDENWGYESHPKELLVSNLGEFKDFAEVHEGYSTDNDTVTHIIAREYDYIWIDGDHREGTLLLELLMVDHLTENIVLHDYGHPGVVPAVDKFCEIRGYKLNVWRPGEFGLASIEKS